MGNRVCKKLLVGNRMELNNFNENMYRYLKNSIIINF